MKSNKELSKLLVIFRKVACKFTQANRYGSLKDFWPLPNKRIKCQQVNKEKNTDAIRYEDISKEWILSLDNLMEKKKLDKRPKQEEVWI